MSAATTQVILYFDSPADASRITLAASSALAGDGKKSNDHPYLSREIKRANGDEVFSSLMRYGG